MINSSCIYKGTVVHKRFKPKKHFFKYNVFSMLIDLDEINEMDKKLGIFSFNKFNILSFFNIDHGPRNGSSLINWVKSTLRKNKIHFNGIKIKLLCYPRIFGYVFNPLSIFYIYDSKNKLITVIYEVKNTFGEQHSYIFKVNNKSNILKHKCEKKFYVSPFIKMNCTYNFVLTKPSNTISVLIDQHDEKSKLLVASQNGKKLKITNSNLIKTYLSYPLMSFKVIAAIHYEAFKLWFKGVSLVKKNIKIRNKISREI